MQLKDIDITKYDTILLDRDGTINVHIIGGYVCRWADFEFIPDVVETIAKWSKKVKYIFIITNQRGIGRGKYTDKDLADIHQHMCEEIEAYGGRIDKIYYCSALSDDDERRKPHNGMFLGVMKDFPDVKLCDCVMIGDGEVDMKFAENCGIDGIRVDSLKKDNGSYYTVKARMD